MPTWRTETEKENREYFSWLCKRVGAKDKSQIELCWLLYNKAFFWSIPNDDNRAKDGLKLREVFSEHGIDHLKENCSVFEMLVALSIRASEILYTPRKKNWESTIFWEMIRNLGLKMFSFDAPQSERIIKKNDSILNNFLQRRFETSGRGGLFPIAEFVKDQRTTEIWYQMMGYLNEKYF